MPPTHRRRPNRRQFLHGTALLGWRARDRRSSRRLFERWGPDWPSDLKIATPEKPVTWDIPRRQQADPGWSGAGEDATLRIFTYDDYISRKRWSPSRRDTARGWRSRPSTAPTTHWTRSGTAPTSTSTPQLRPDRPVGDRRSARPLNHSYFPNIKNVWPAFHNPWYDGEWRYSVPYTVYSTGIGWRTDQITADIGALANPYDALWDPAHRDQTAIIDDVTPQCRWCC